MSEPLITLADHLITQSKAIPNISSTEIYLLRKKTRVIRMIRGELQINEVLEDTGGSIRTIRDKKVGFVTFTSPEQGLKALQQSVDIAKRPQKILI